MVMYDWEDGWEHRRIKAVIDANGLLVNPGNILWLNTEAGQLERLVTVDGKVQLDRNGELQKKLEVHAGPVIVIFDEPSAGRDEMVGDGTDDTAD